jgi:hypothetical protein
MHFTNFKNITVCDTSHRDDKNIETTKRAAKSPPPLNPLPRKQEPFATHSGNTASCVADEKLLIILATLICFKK